MKKSSKLLLGMCLAIGLVIALIGCATLGTHESGHFIYKVYESIDGKHAEITGYNNTDGGRVAIPSRLGGRPVISISNGAFKNKGITEVIFSNTLEFIRNSAFEQNKLTKVIFPENIIRIGDFAFNNNEITEVVFPQFVRESSYLIYLGKAAFQNNKLTKVIIPEGVKRISSWAFAVNEISEVVIPQTVEYIGVRAFGNNKLTSIKMPSNIKILGTDVFINNNLITPFEFPDTVERIILQFSTQGLIGEAIIEKSVESSTLKLLSLDNTNTPEINIPSDGYGIPVTHIGSSFTRGTSSRKISINNLRLPATLRVIETNAFAFCNITNVHTPNQTVQTIWNEYYALQQQLDSAADQAERDRLLQSMQRMSETLDALE